MQPEQKPAPDQNPKLAMQHELKLMPSDPSLTAADATPLVHPQPVITEIPPAPTDNPVEAAASSLPPVPNTAQEQPLIKEYKTPWLKLAALGIFAPISAIVIYLVIAIILVRVLPDNTLIKLFQYGIMQLLMAGLLFAILYRVYLKLSSWMVSGAGMITCGTFILILTSTILVKHLQTYSFYNLIFSGDVGKIQRIASNLEVIIIPLAGLVGVLMLTFIFNNLEKPSKTIRSGLAIQLVMLPFIITLVYTPKPTFGQNVTSSANATKSDSGEVVIPKSNTIAWGYLPTKLPQGVTGIKECANEPSGYEIMCDLHFTDYPGYLSEASQQKITASFNGGAGPSEESFKLPSEPWVTIFETEKDSNFNGYYYKSGKCDIFGLRSTMSIAAPYRTNNPNNDPPKMTSCTQVTTPAGTTLYRQDLLQNGINQPNSYYFVKDNTVIVLDHNQIIGNSSVAATQYFVDPNYQTQLYQFVDSFVKNK